MYAYKCIAHLHPYTGKPHDMYLFIINQGMYREFFHGCNNNFGRTRKYKTPKTPRTRLPYSPSLYNPEILNHHTYHQL